MPTALDEGEEQQTNGQYVPDNCRYEPTGQGILRVENVPVAKGKKRSKAKAKARYQVVCVVILVRSCHQVSSSRWSIAAPERPDRCFKGKPAAKAYARVLPRRNAGYPFELEDWALFGDRQAPLTR